MSGTTTKKMKVVGTESYINTSTGELHEMQVVEIEERDAHFQKIWVASILGAVEELSSKKLKIVLWLVRESAKHRNVIPMSTQQLADSIGVSRTTISDTLKMLEKHDVVRRETGRVWMNPSVVFKGGTKGRMEVLTRYKAVQRQEEPEETQEERASRLEREEERLLKQLESLRAERQTLHEEAEQTAAAE